MGLTRTRLILVLAATACSSVESPVALPAPHLSVLFFPTGADLSWDPVPGATKGYQVTRENPDGSHLFLGTVFGNGVTVPGPYAVGQRFLVNANQDGVYPPNIATVTAGHPLPGVTLNFTARSVHVAWDAQGFGPGVIQRRIDPSNAEETIGTSSTGDFEDTTAQ